MQAFTATRYRWRSGARRLPEECRQWSAWPRRLGKLRAMGTGQWRSPDTKRWWGVRRVGMGAGRRRRRVRQTRRGRTRVVCGLEAKRWVERLRWKKALRLRAELRA